MGYSGNPDGSAVDRVRVLIGDTDNNNLILQDSEIEYYLVLYNQDCPTAAYFALDQIIAAMSRHPDKRTGQQQVSYKNPVEWYKELQQRLAPKADLSGVYAGGVSQSDIDTVQQDTDRPARQFVRDDFDNDGITTYENE